MNKFTELKNKIEELNREIIFSQFSGQQLLNELQKDRQNGIVIGDDFLDEIREEFLGGDFDSTNEEIENKLSTIGKDKEYKEYLENVIRDLKLEIED